MEQSYIILLIILTLSLFIKSDSLAIASSILILMKLLNLDLFFPKLEHSGIKIGIIILTIAVLAPIAENKYSIKNILLIMKSPMGISAIIAATLVILFTGKGYNLLISNPLIIMPIILGSLIGIVSFKGIPVGPLVSAGITFILYNIIILFMKLFR